eukprot:m.134508 g.134508  ORF g.134508 m.134508 type:complete len:210 (-) comp15824_c0_seq4:3203-3832(-)
MLAVLALVLLGLLVGVRSTPTTKTTDRHYQATNLNTQTHLWLQSDLAEAKRRIAVGELQSAFKGLEDAAIQTLDAIEWTILNKTLVPASKDMRDYVSIAIYNWPCNATPPGCKDYPGSVWPPCNETTALPWRACDGIVDTPAVNAGDSPHASAVQSAATTLALTYVLTGICLLLQATKAPVSACFLVIKLMLTRPVHYLIGGSLTWKPA